MSIAINVDVEPVEIDGKHFVVTRANGRETSRQGPFLNADAARAAADRHMRRWRKTAGGNGTAERSSKSARENELPSVPAKAVMDTASFVENDAFVQDMARFSTGDLSETQIRKRYHLPEDAWTKLGEDENLVSKIEAETLRRTRSGETKRERAQKFVTEVPRVMNDILMNANASPRHRIDAGKTLNDLAANPSQNSPDNSRFCITIVLNADGSTDARDVIHFDKPIKIGVEDDTDTKIDKPNTIDADEPDCVDPALLIAAGKRGNESGGQPL
jgi:hypothetical protein